MPTISDVQQLPPYQSFVDSIAMLALPFSGSELHGIMCGYLSAGATRECIAYLSTLIANPNDPDMRPATRALFEVYAVSQQQLKSLGFEFQLLLLDDSQPLEHRAHAFSDWCEGYAQGIRMAGVEYNELEDEDTQDALQHISEFADMDYEALQIEEDDERALMEVIEYTRMAVLQIHGDAQINHPDKGTETTH